MSLILIFSQRSFIASKKMFSDKNESSTFYENVFNFSSISYLKKKLATLVEVDPKAPFSITTTPRCLGGVYFFPWIVPLYPYLIILSVKQGSIKYHFGVFAMTRPGIETRSPGLLANILFIWPIINILNKWKDREKIFTKQTLTTRDHHHISAFYPRKTLNWLMGWFQLYFNSSSVFFLTKRLLYLVHCTCIFNFFFLVKFVKYIYSTHRWDSNWYSNYSEPGSNDNKEVLLIKSCSFNVLPRIPLLKGVGRAFLEGDSISVV